MNELKLSKKLALPVETLTSATAVLGLRGSGKTNTAGVIVEEALELGQQAVIIDPLGVWYGLRSNREGTKAGYPVLVIGGYHGDIPLEETSGKIVADFIVEPPLRFGSRFLAAGVGNMPNAMRSDSLADVVGPLMAAAKECGYSLRVEGGAALHAASYRIDVVRTGSQLAFRLVFNDKRLANLIAANSRQRRNAGLRLQTRASIGFKTATDARIVGVVNRLSLSAMQCAHYCGVLLD